MVLQDPDGFALDVVVGGEHGGTHRIYLDNLYLATRDLEPDARQEAIRDFCAEMLRPRAPRGSWAADRARLRPVLRSSMTFSGMPVVRQSVLPHLVEAVVVDSPLSVAYATEDDLLQWGVERDEAFAAAQANLAASGGDQLVSYDHEAPRPLLHLASSDGYEASWLLISGWLASLAERLGRPPVAAVPHRTALVVCGDHPDDIARLQSIADREYDASAGPISPGLYTVDPVGAVVPLRLTADHPAHVAVRSSHARLQWDEEWG